MEKDFVLTLTRVLDHTPPRLIKAAATMAPPMNKMMSLQAGEGGVQIWAKLAAAVARKLLEPGGNLWIRSPKDPASSDPNEAN